MREDEGDVQIQTPHTEPIKKLEKKKEVSTPPPFVKLGASVPIHFDAVKESDENSLISRTSSNHSLSTTLDGKEMSPKELWLNPIKRAHNDWEVPLQTHILTF